MGTIISVALSNEAFDDSDKNIIEIYEQFITDPLDVCINTTLGKIVDNMEKIEEHPIRRGFTRSDNWHH